MKFLATMFVAALFLFVTVFMVELAIPASVIVFIYGSIAVGVWFQKKV
jgi:hypothetical protein